jgi:DNA (cytosine-5)-methyltransferase 1
VEGFSTYRRVARMLTDLKYFVSVGVLDAKHFGVPQTRRRLVMLALRGKPIELPTPTHGPGFLPFRTVRDAIAHYPALAAGEQHAIVPNHRVAMLSATNAERIALTPRDGGSRASWPKKLWLPCHLKHGEAHTDSYGRMSWDRPAPTLTCKCHSLSNGRYGHPEQDRAISLREAATLQTFPENYAFHGTSIASLATQIGNAVPVSFARALGTQILAALDA